MIKRWIIRSFLVALLVACVVVWVASYFGWFIANKQILGHLSQVDIFLGQCSLAELNNPRDPDSRLGYAFLRGMKHTDWHPAATTLGFYVGPVPKWPDSFQVVFPLWLPTLLLAGLNWIVWRKTRPKPLGHAFPVEPDAKPGRPQP